MKKIIRITCKGSRTVPFGSLRDFQGRLKDLSRDDLDKLKRLIVKHGFSFPYFVWEGRDFILDGHQRTHALEELLREGYTLEGELPVVDIQAATEKEAAEKLLALTSHYGRITDEGLYEFLNTKGLDIADLADDLSLPDVDMERFLEGWGGNGGGGFPGDNLIPDKDPNIIVRLSFHPGLWLGKREEIMSVFERMEKAYECSVKVEE